MNEYITKASSGAKNIVIDDMFLTVDLPTTAGSKMLEGYKSLFEAEVVTKLKDAGYTVCGKANNGEFALDLLGETSYFGACTDSEGNLCYAPAQIVANGDAQGALVLDVNGAPSRGAALSGLCYLKPTYGTVSRFGTIPAACSGETVGIISKDSEGCKAVLDIISGHDDKDGTSLPPDKCELAKAVGTVKKIAIASALVAKADDETQKSVKAFADAARAQGVEVTEIDGEELLLAKAAWNILMSAEVCNNVSRYDGVKFGYRAPDYKTIDELYTNSRTQSFGYLLKSTILFGSETLSEDNYMKIYDKALRIRRVISEYMSGIFADYDAILAPACSKSAYTVAEAEANKYIAYDESLFTAPASVTGLPVMTVKGVNLIGKPLSDGTLADFASKIEKGGAL